VWREVTWRGVQWLLVAAIVAVVRVTVRVRVGARVRVRVRMWVRVSVCVKNRVRVRLTFIPLLHSISSLFLYGQIPK
jgi:hypothetical protein